MAYFCPEGRLFGGAEEAVNTLVSDNCEGEQTAKTIFLAIGSCVNIKRE